MIRSQLTPSVPLMLLLACSACAPAGERVAPVAPRPNSWDMDTPEGVWVVASVTMLIVVAAGS